MKQKKSEIKVLHIRHCTCMDPEQVRKGNITIKFTHLHTVKGGSDLGSTKRKTHVSGVSGSDGVHGKTTGLVSGSGKSSLGVNIDGSTHESGLLIPMNNSR